MVQSWPLLAFGFASVFWGNFGQSFFISWYGAEIQASLDLSAGRYGSIYSLATLASGFLIMLFGGLIDRWPLKRFAAAAALGLVAACLTLAAAFHEIMLLLGFFLVRFFGQGLLPHTAQTTMGRYFEVNRGKALSISISGVPAGEVVLPLMAVALIGLMGWRLSWVVIALGTLLLYLPMMSWCLNKSGLESARASAARRTGSTASFLAGGGGRRRMLSDHRFWLALPTLMAGPFLITAVFIHQPFILAEKGWTPAWLATCFVVYGVIHWFSSMTAGVLIDRLSARFLLRLLPLPLAAAMFSLVYLEGEWVALLFMALLGTSIGTATPVGGALWAEVYGTARLGSIRSLVASLMIFATAASPVILGVMIDRQLTLQEIFGNAGLAVLLAGVLAQFSYRRPRRAAVGCP